MGQLYLNLFLITCLLTLSRSEKFGDTTDFFTGIDIKKSDGSYGLFKPGYRGVYQGDFQGLGEGHKRLEGGYGVFRPAYHGTYQGDYTGSGYSYNNPLYPNRGQVGYAGEHVGGFGDTISGAHFSRDSSILSGYSGYLGRSTNFRPGYNTYPGYNNPGSYAGGYPGYNQPSFNQYGPGYNQYTPGYNQYTPGYNQYNPGYNQYNPGYNNNRPGSNQYRPGFNQYGPGVNQYGPGVSQYGPGYNQFRPGFNQVRPGYPGNQGNYFGGYNDGYNDNFRLLGRKAGEENKKSDTVATGAQ